MAPPPRRKHRWSLSTHLTWVVLLALLPAMVILSISNLELRRDAEKQAEAQVLHAVNELAAQQDEVVVASRQMLTTLAFLPEVRHSDWKGLSAILKAIRTEDPRYTNLSATDPDGMMSASAVPFARIPLSDRRFYREAVRTRRFSAGEYVVSRTTGMRTLHFSLPVYREDGSLIMVLVAAYDLASYDKLFNLAGLPKGSVLAVCDHRGTVLHHVSDLDAMYGSTIGAPQSPKHMDRMTGPQEEGTYWSARRNGTSMLNAFHQLKLSPDEPPYLYIRVGLPGSAVLEAGQARYRRNTLLLVLTGLLALGAAWAMGNRVIAAPIRRLAAASRRIGKGHLDLRPSVTTASREVADLAEELGAMGQALAQREEEQQRTQEALRHAQKMESLGLLAGGIAHDFNNLLSAILGNLNLAQIKTPEEAPSQAHLRNAEQAVMKASDLSRQMLAYSGRGHFVVSPQDLNQMAEDMSELLRVSISKKTSLVLDLAPGLPPVLADGAQLQQVLLNLVTNASDAIGDREGTIRIATELEVLDPQAMATLLPAQDRAPGRYVRLEVSDTGCGMSPDLQQRIFDPFFTTKARGRGLGLSAMLGILRGHGAGLRIESAEGRGSTFKVYFPEAAGDLPLEAACEELSPETFSGLVLVADDEDLVRQAACEALEAMGFSVLAAQDGAEALALFEPRMDAIRLVLLDLTMPRMNGIEAFTAMRRLKPDLRVILSSGYDSQDTAQDIVGQGLAGFLPKPYLFRELHRAVSQILAEAQGNPSASALP